MSDQRDASTTAEPVTSQLPPVDVDPQGITLKSRKLSVQLDPIVEPAQGPVVDPFVQAPPTQVYYPIPQAGGAPPAIPPAAVPPVAVPAPTPSEPFLVRHRWKVLIAALTVAALAAAAILLLTRGSSDRDAATDVLSSSAQEVKRVLTSTAQVQKTDGLAAAGRDAETAVATIGQLNARLTEIESNAIRASVSQVLAAEAGVLTGLSGLKNMKRDAKSLGTWQSQIKSQVQTAESQLSTANTAIQQLELKDAAAVTVSNADVAATVNHVESLVSNAKSIVQKHNADLRKARAKKRRLRAKAEALQSYGNSVVAIYNTYYQDRDKTQAFFQNVAPAIGPDGDHDIDEAKSALQEYIADRNRTISQLQAITPPAGMENAHQGLTGVVNTSLTGLEAFRRAIDEYFTTPPDYGLTESPSWSEAARISDQVTSQYTAARNAWEANLGALLRKTNRNVKVPRLGDI